MTLSETQASRHPDDAVRSCSAGSGLPPIAQITFPACRAHYPGGSNRYISVLLWCAPAPGFPDSPWPSRRTQPVGIHTFMFRGLLRLHSRYGLQFCSPTSSGLCHEAPVPTVTRLNRSSATQAYRFLLAWDFHPLVICAIGAHVRDKNVDAPAPLAFNQSSSQKGVPKQRRTPGAADRRERLSLLGHACACRSHG